MGNALKVILRLRRRFWPEDFYDAVCADCFMPEVWLSPAAELMRPDAKPPFTIVGFVAGERAERVAKEMGFPANSYTVIKCELGSFKSVRDFVFNLRAFKGPRGLDALVCNAAVYLPVRAAASSLILNVTSS